MHNQSNSEVHYSWFRSRGGHRFGVEFAAIVGLKLVALTLIWFLCFHSQPPPDVSPAAIGSHLVAPAVESAHDR